MRINIIADSDGDFGMGHIVRQHRLAQVLRQRGGDVHFCWLDTESSPRGVELVRGGPDSIERPDEDARYSDVTIVDRMSNDDKELENIRQYCDKLVVFVGVGSTITPDTYWIADYVIWQTAENGIILDVPSFLQEKTRAGKDWLILSPSLRAAEIPRERHGIATYFGGGVDKERMLAAISEGEQYTLGEQGYWKDDIGPSLLKSRAFFGTMGMVAYEAMAAGLRPLVISRSEDHLRTAGRLSLSGLTWDLGLAEDWNSEATEMATRLLDGPPRDLQVSNWQRPDGWGAWRIADLILNGDG